MSSKKGIRCDRRVFSQIHEPSSRAIETRFREGGEPYIPGGYNVVARFLCPWSGYDCIFLLEDVDKIEGGRRFYYCFLDRSMKDPHSTVKWIGNYGNDDFFGDRIAYLYSKRGSDLFEFETGLPASWNSCLKYLFLPIKDSKGKKYIYNYLFHSSRIGNFFFGTVEDPIVNYVNDRGKSFPLGAATLSDESFRINSFLHTNWEGENYKDYMISGKYDSYRSVNKSDREKIWNEIIDLVGLNYETPIMTGSGRLSIVFHL